MSKSKSPNERRVALRERLWPGSAAYIYNPSVGGDVGYARLSRLTPWVLRLIDDLAGKSGSPSKAYIELLCRDMGVGLVEIDDPSDNAFAAGYDSGRGLRTWRDHMRKLIELGFIAVKPDGNREFGKVLILHPLAVCAKHHANKKVSEAWWTSFLSRAEAVSAEIPDASMLPEATEPSSAGSRG